MLLSQVCVLCIRSGQGTLTLADHKLCVAQHLCSVHASCAPQQLLRNGNKVSSFTGNGCLFSMAMVHNFEHMRFYVAF